MSQNSLGSSLLSAVAAFFSSGSSTESERTHRVYVGEPGGLSGVAKYLQEQEALLARQRAEQLEQLAAQASASGVAKYLAKQAPLTGVERYALRQAIADRETGRDLNANSGATGVDKYLKNMKQPAVSSVERYLKRQESLPQMSKVAKYMAKQAIAEKQAKESQPKLTGVAKYLAQQDNAPQMSKVAKYMAKQAILDAKRAKDAEEGYIATSETSVAKYMKRQEELPQLSKVAKYLARQALAEQKTI